jgi:hypothetical protein
MLNHVRSPWRFMHDGHRSRCEAPMCGTIVVSRVVGGHSPVVPTAEALHRPFSDWVLLAHARREVMNYHRASATCDSIQHVRSRNLEVQTLSLLPSASMTIIISQPSTATKSRPTWCEFEDRTRGAKKAEARVCFRSNVNSGKPLDCQQKAII